MPTYQGEGAGPPAPVLAGAAFPLSGGAEEGREHLSAPTSPDPPPPVLCSSPLPLLAILGSQKGNVAEPKLCLGRPSGLERSLKGALLKVLHSLIPFQFVSEIEENLFFPTLHFPKPSLGHGSIMGRSLISAFPRRPMIQTVPRARRGGLGEAGEGASVSLDFGAPGS